MGASSGGRRMGRSLLVIASLLCMACAKSSLPTAVRTQPIHPELQCPAGTLATGTVPPDGKEAWCDRQDEGRPPVRQGPSLTWHDNGQKESQGAYANGQRTGPWLFWHANGRPAQQGPYVDDQRHGVWTTYDPQGRRIAEGPMVAGAADGDWTFWNPDAQTRTEGHYVLGRREGEWIEYSPEGTPVRARTFRDDRMLDVRDLQ